MSKEPRRVFLDPSSYRGRRARDASRLLPILGLFLFFLPGMWPETSGGGLYLSRSMIFLFVVWAILIAVAAFLTRYLEDRAEGEEPDKNL